jgi:hypothetical protein
MESSLNKVTTDAGVSSVKVLKQLNSMIKSNITIIIILFVMVVILGFGLYYFVNSLISTLSKYQSRKEMNRTSNSESLKDKAADNEEYPEQSDPNNIDVEEDDMRVVVDPTKFMPKPKRDFISKLTIENKEYNKDKTEFVTRKLNYPENDDVVDDKILYKDYDDYQYDYNTE